MNNWNNLVNTIKSIDDVENIRLNENKTAVSTAAKKAVKAIPFAGAALSFHDAWSRWRSGDRSGAVLSALTGAAYSVPVVGTGLGLGMDAYGAYRDYQRNSENPDASVVQTKENKVSEVEKIIKLKNTLDSISKKSIHEASIKGKALSMLGDIILNAVPPTVRNRALEIGRGALDKVDDAVKGASKSKIEVPAKTGGGPRTPDQQASMDAAAGRATTGAPAGAPAGGSTLTRPGPDATPAELAAYRAAKQEKARKEVDRTATPAGGSGGSSPPGGRSGATAEPAPATATGGAGGAGGGGGIPPTVTPPASLPPSGGGAGGAGGAGGTVGRPAEVASDVGRSTSTGGTVYNTPTGLINKAGSTNPNAQATGSSQSGGPLANPANTTVTTTRTAGTGTPSGGAGGGTTGGTTGGPLANPANTTVTTTRTAGTGTPSGGAGGGTTGGTPRPAGTAGGGAGRTVAAGAAGIATGAAINAVLDRPDTPGTDNSDPIDYTQAGTDMQGTAMSSGGNYVIPGTRPSDYPIAAGGRPAVQNTAATTAAVPDDRYERDIISRSAVSGYTPGGRDDPDTPDPITSRTEVTPQERVTTVDAQAQPERSPAGSTPAQPSGSGVSLRGGIEPNVGGNIGQGTALPANFGAAPQGFRFSPEQERWLTMPTQDGRPGNPNRQDPYILNRMIKKVGGPIPPLSYFKDADDRVIAKRLGFPEVPLGNGQTLNTGVGRTTVPLAQTQQQPQQSVSTAPQVQQQISQQGQSSVQSTQSTAQSGQPFQFTQAQEKWLTMPTQDGRPGNPNRQDPYILRNMARKAGGPLPPVSYFKDPEDQALARRMGFPMNESNNELSRLKELIKKI